MKNDIKDLPRSTYWPLFFGLALTIIAWGLITSWIVSMVGTIVLFISTVGWIIEVSNEA